MSNMPFCMYILFIMHINIFLYIHVTVLYYILASFQKINVNVNPQLWGSWIQYLISSFGSPTVYFISLISLPLGSSILVSTTSKNKLSNGNSKGYHWSTWYLLLVQLIVGEVYIRCLLVLWLHLRHHKFLFLSSPIFASLPTLVLSTFLTNFTSAPTTFSSMNWCGFVSYSW